MLNVIDLLIIIILIFCFLIGFKKSMIPGLVALGGTILILVISYMFKNILGNVLCNYMPFFDFDGVPALNILLYQGISFLLIFGILTSVLVIVLKVSGVLQKIVNSTLVLWLPSKIIGGIIGVLIGYICLFVVIVALFVPFNSFPIYKESVLIDVISNKTPILSKYGEGFIESFKETYKLSDELGKDKIDKKYANDKLLDKFIEYIIIDEEELKYLKDKKKI